jgi:hypothetical protein
MFPKNIARKIRVLFLALGADGTGKAETRDNPWANG